jgi:hypothetical protein
MKKILSSILFAAVLSGVACSRSDKQDSSGIQTPTPNPSLKSDAERLQQATANAARERERAAQLSPTPSASQP